MTTSSRAPRRFSQPSSCSPPSDYGAPVPGYDAPPDRTLQPGTRIGAFLVGVLAACHERGDAYFHEVLDQELARFGLGAPAGGTRRP